MQTLDTPEIMILKRIFAALNANDILAIRPLLHPDVLRVEFEDLPQGGSYRGLDQVIQHFKDGRGTWAEGSCTPEKFFVNGHKVVSLTHVLVRQNGKHEWIDGHVADAFAFIDGQAIEFRSFLKLEQAIEWLNKS